MSYLTGADIGTRPQSVGAEKVGHGVLDDAGLQGEHIGWRRQGSRGRQAEHIRMERGERVAFRESHDERV